MLRAEVGIVRGRVICDRRHPATKHTRSTHLMVEAFHKHEHGLLQNTRARIPLREELLECREVERSCISAHVRGMARVRHSPRKHEERTSIQAAREGRREAKQGGGVHRSSSEGLQAYNKPSEQFENKYIVVSLVDEVAGQIQSRISSNI